MAILMRSSTPEAMARKKELEQFEYISRNQIFKCLWMDEVLEQRYKPFLMENHPIIFELDRCVKEFREIFQKQNMSLLYIFIERYENSPHKHLATFAKGLAKDIDAVENAVASPLSNGFVEGTNSRLKMIKRTMYGRASKKLLSAKMMYSHRGKYG